MSRNSLGVVRNVPVMASAAVLCILVRFRRMVTDPECLDWPFFFIRRCVPGVDAVCDFG